MSHKHHDNQDYILDIVIAVSVVLLCPLAIAVLKLILRYIKIS